jgi:hypothetical protein
MDTENVDDPFLQVETSLKVILGGRSFKLLSDGRTESQK